MASHNHVLCLGRPNEDLARSMSQALRFCSEPLEPVETRCLHDAYVLHVPFGHFVCSVVKAKVSLRRGDEALLLDPLHTFFREVLIPNISADLDDGDEPFICDVKSPIVLAGVFLIERS